MRRPLATVLATALLSSGFALAAAPAEAVTPGALLYGLTSSNHLVGFRDNAPGTATSDVAVTGLAAGETLLGLDFRPATGALLVLGSTGRLYTVDTLTGAATATTGTAPTLSGTAFGVDVNPVPDRVRVVSDADQNLRLNHDTGALAADDTTLQYAAGDANAAANPNVVAAAYTNSFAGATATTLYDIDSALDVLVTQNPPNNGTLNTVGPLGVDASDVAGLDIDPTTGKAYALLTVGGTAGLYTVNLTTGAATLVGAAVTGLVDVAAPVISRPAYVLLSDNTLGRVDVSRAATVSGVVPITGTTADVVGIDVRPATGELYAVTLDSKLYKVDPATGAATQVGTSGAFGLNGTAFGVDFNPVPDRLRIVSDTGQNLRVNPNDGTLTATDTALNGGPARAIGAGYANSFPGTTTTTLYDLDDSTDSLYVQNPPNAGTLVLVGATGVDFTAASDLDLAPDGNVAYAVLTVGGTPSLYRINLTTGAATVISAFSSALVEDLALAAPGKLAAAPVSTDEAQAVATVTVTRTLGSAGVVGVDYATGGGTATAGSDYTATSGTLRFADGETSKTFTVPLLQDTVTEGLETIGLTFTDELGGIPAVAASSIAVTDDEVATAYALTTGNNVATLSLNTPGTYTSSVPVTGTTADVVGIDVRPATGALYALTADGKLYTVDPTTGAATLASTLSTALNGTAFGVDFNPVPDRLRIVSDSGQNLRVNVDTGAVTVDTALNPATTGVTAAAYTNSFAGTTATTLYDVDTASDTLVVQNPPNNGTLTAVGPLGVDVAPAGDLDIAANGNAAFGAFTAAGTAGLYRLDLATGAATLVGAFGTNDVEDLALASPGRIGFSSATYSVSEAGPTVTVTVTRTAGSTGTVSATYTTADGTAKAGSDYTATTGTVTFADGATAAQTFTVPVAQDTVVEGPERFTVALSAVTGGAGTANSPATVTITDDETGSAYGLTTDNRVVTLDPTAPTAAPSRNVALAGLGNDDVLGIDVRPANGKLYAITSSGRILLVDPTTGATQLVSTSSTAPAGTTFGVDFNPVADRLRVVSSTGQSLRINVDTGAATVDGSLAYATGDANAGQTPTVAGAAYTNSVKGATATQLFDLDVAKDVLDLQNPPNNGTLTTVGALGLDATTVAGFDIAAGNEAFAVLVPTGGAAGLYRVDLATGAASLVGALATTTVEDIAFPTGAVAAAGGYHALPPTRLVDTRTTGGAVRAGNDRLVQVTGQSGVPATGVSAVVLNVTVTGGTSRGNIAVYPAGAKPASRTSNLNYASGQTIAVQVQTGVGATGAVGLSVSGGTANLVVDVLGWYGDATDTSGQSYQPLSPSRLLDTRTTGGALRAGSPRSQQVTGLNGVPAGATAVAVNVTVTGPTNDLYVSLFPGGAAPATRTSTLNAVQGQTVANAAVVTLGADGSLGLSVNKGSVQVVLDVVGYYGATGTSRFVPLTPARLLDTRTTGGPVVPGADRVLTVAGAGGVPATASAAALVVTGTRPTGALYVQVYPVGAAPASPTSTLNLRPGQEVANLAVSPLGTGGAVALKVSNASVQLVVDVTGYFTR